MDAQEQDSSTVWAILKFALLVKSYTICPLVKFAIGYGLFTTGMILLTVLYKMRYQVFNRDLKLQRAKCENRILLITGAGSGIGLALARYFHTKGFVIVGCCYSKDESGFIELSKLLDSKRKKMHLVELDVQSQKSIESCYKYVRKLMDENSSLRLHALINVAGIGIVQKFQWVPRKVIRDVVEINLLGPMLMTRQFLHLLIKHPGGRVVNVASPLGIFPTEMSCVYGPTKAGLAHFSSALEADTARYGLRTVTIQPGNLIRNTSIVNASLAGKLDSVRDELNDDETCLYRDEMQQHLRYMELMDRARTTKEHNLELSTSSSFRSNLKKLGMIISGGLTTLKLDESRSFVQSFDNSIRLKNPPREMFTGNIFFVIVVDSLTQWLGRTLVREPYLNMIRLMKGGKFSNLLI